MSLRMPLAYGSFLFVFFVLLVVPLHAGQDESDLDEEWLGKGLDDETFNAALLDVFEPIPLAMGNVQPQGVIQDEDDEPLADVQCTLLMRPHGAVRYELIDQVRTDERGRFTFKGVPESEEEGSNDTYLILAQAPGRASLEVPYYPRNEAVNEQLKELTMKRATVVRGTVTGPDGEPLAGILVRMDVMLGHQPIVGFRSALTDMSGNYRLEDVGEAVPHVERLDALTTRVTQISVRFQHHDYVHRRLSIDRVPGELSTTLRLGGVMRGKVVDHETGTPLPHIKVLMNADREPRPRPVRGESYDIPHRNPIRTDENGEYEFRGLPDDFRYNVKISDDDSTAVAISGIELTAGETLEVPNLEARDGGFLVGRLIDRETKEPFMLEEGNHIRLGIYGASRPPGGSIESCLISPDGTFRYRLAPGEHFIYNSTPSAPVNMQIGGPRVSEPRVEITIVEGEETVIEIEAWR